MAVNMRKLWKSEAVMGKAGADSAPAPASAAAPKPIPQPPAADPKILGLQKALKRFGYDPGLIDGVMGDNTRAALKKYQKDKGVPPSGTLDAKTQGVLLTQLAAQSQADLSVIAVKGTSAAAADLAEKQKAAAAAKAKAEAAAKAKTAAEADKNIFEQGVDYLQKAAAMPGDEQFALAGFGPEGLKQMQEGKARAAKRQSTIGELNSQYNATHQIPQTDLFAPIEIIKGRLMSRSERMDAMLIKLNMPPPNANSDGIDEFDFDEKLERGEIQPSYQDYLNQKVDHNFLTDAEYLAELHERAKKANDHCKEGIKRPGTIDTCIREADSKYGGEEFELRRAAKEAEAQAAHNVYQGQADGVANSGGAGTAGRLVGYGVGYLLGRDEKSALKGSEWGAAIGGLADGALPGVRGPNMKARSAKQNENRPVPEVEQNVAVGKPSVEPPVEPPGPVSVRTPALNAPANSSANAVPGNPPAAGKKPSGVPAAKNAGTAGSDAGSQARSKSRAGGGEGGPTTPGYAEKLMKNRKQRPGDNEIVTIKTSKGQEQMTAGEYRTQVEKARKWRMEEIERQRFHEGKEHPDTQEIDRQAAEKFGLNQDWQSAANPIIHGGTP